MKIVIIGSTGQLGTDLLKVFGHEHETVGLTHRDLEVSDYNSCSILKEYHPDVTINTAAFHKTDQCEDEPLKAFSVNAIGARNIATVSKEIGSTSVFISTDYVFDGSKLESYSEDDVPNPINAYGVSKLAGELFTRQSPKHYVVRVASLFGVAGASGKGGNFIETMVAKAKKGEPIGVVDDMWMSPTYTQDAASAIKSIIELNLPFGVYHATNKGKCTWFEFAKEIFKSTGLDPVLMRTKTEQLKGRAARPLFSALKSAKLGRYGIEMRDWTDALQDYLVAKGYLSASLFQRSADP